MSDDSPFPPNKSGKHPNSLANLIKSKPGDPSRNPTGTNGRTRVERIVKILDGAAVTDVELAMVEKLGLPKDTPLIDALVHREVIAGLGKSDAARKGLREQYAGKPHVSVDLSNEDGSLAGPKVLAYLPSNGRGPRADQPQEAPAENAEPSGDKPAA